MNTGPSKLWPRLLLLAIVLASLLLGAGLAGPCLAIEPSFGRLDGWVRLLKPAVTRPTEYSVLGGIYALIENGSVGVGVLLFAFSVVFPTLKLAVMAGATAALAAGRPAGVMVRLAHHAGKFSMLDVFVAGLLVLAIKGLPGDSRATLGWGVGAFAASVVMAMLIGFAIERLERQRIAEAVLPDSVA